MIFVNTTNIQIENEKKMKTKKVKPIMERNLMFSCLVKKKDSFFNLVYSVSTFHAVNMLPTSMSIIFHKIRLLVNSCFLTA